METMLNFVSKFTNVVKSHLDETEELIGKDVVDASAARIGVCVDKVKVAFGAKFSLLNNYTDEQMKELESFGEDVIVCQGNDGSFFVPFSEIMAIGGSVILVRPTLSRPEIGSMGKRREEVFRKYHKTKTSIKEILPKVETGTTRKKKKRTFLLFH
jgi:sporulation protein YlmC with PRC-barrel domain